jgi:hypothetical protein
MNFYSIICLVPCVATLPWPAVVIKRKVYVSVLRLLKKSYLNQMTGRF